MIPSTRSVVPRETDQDKDHRDNPDMATGQEEICFNEQACPGTLEGFCVPDERALETFSEGAGI
jgi:hypothetical protein